MILHPIVDRYNSFLVQLCTNDSTRIIVSTRLYVEYLLQCCLYLPLTFLYKVKEGQCSNPSLDCSTRHAS